VSLEDSTLKSAVTLLANKSGTVVAGNTVGGPLTCAGNKPAPVNNGLKNKAGGLRLGQCAKL
jgi:hypothetical protein